MDGAAKALDQVHEPRLFQRDSLSADDYLKRGRLLSSVVRLADGFAPPDFIAEAAPDRVTGDRRGDPSDSRQRDRHRFCECRDQAASAKTKFGLVGSARMSSSSVLLPAWLMVIVLSGEAFAQQYQYGRLDTLTSPFFFHPASISS